MMKKFLITKILCPLAILTSIYSCTKDIEREAPTHSEDEYIYVTLTGVPAETEMRSGLVLKDGKVKSTWEGTINGVPIKTRKVLTTIHNGTKDIFSAPLDWEVTNAGRRLIYNKEIKLKKADLDAASKLTLYAIVGSQEILKEEANPYLPILSNKPTEIDIPHIMVTDLKRIDDTHLAIKTPSTALFRPIGHVCQIHIKNESAYPVYLTGAHTSIIARTPRVGIDHITIESKLGTLRINNHGEVTRDEKSATPTIYFHKLETSKLEDYLILPAGAERSDIAFWLPDSPTNIYQYKTAHLATFGAPITLYPKEEYKKEGTVTHFYGTVKSATSPIQNGAITLPGNLDIQLIENQPSNPENPVVEDLSEQVYNRYSVVPYTSSDGKKLLFTMDEAKAIEESFGGKKYIPNIYQMAYYIPFIPNDGRIPSATLLDPVELFEQGINKELWEYIQFPGSKTRVLQKSIFKADQQLISRSPWVENRKVPFYIYAIRFLNNGDSSRSKHVFLQRWHIYPGISGTALNSIEGSAIHVEVSFLPFDSGVYPLDTKGFNTEEYWLGRKDQIKSFVFSIPYYKENLFASQGIFQNTHRTTLKSVTSYLLCRRSSTAFTPLLVAPWGLGERRISEAGVSPLPDKYPIYLFNAE